MRILGNGGEILTHLKGEIQIQHPLLHFVQDTHSTLGTTVHAPDETRSSTGPMCRDSLESDRQTVAREISSDKN